MELWVLKNKKKDTEREGRMSSSEIALKRAHHEKDKAKYRRQWIKKQEDQAEGERTSALFVGVRAE